MKKVVGSFIYENTVYTQYEYIEDKVIEITRTNDVSVKVLMLVINKDGTVLVGGWAPCGIVTRDKNKVTFTILGDTEPSVVMERNNQVINIAEFTQTVFYLLCKSVKERAENRAKAPYLH